MLEWKIKTTDGPGGEVIINKMNRGYLDSRLAIDLDGRGEYLAVHLTAKEARKIAKGLLNSVVGVNRKK